MRAIHSKPLRLFCCYRNQFPLFPTNTQTHQVWERHRHFQGGSTPQSPFKHAPELTAVVHLLVLHAEDVPEPSSHDLDGAEDQLAQVGVDHALEAQLRHPPEPQHHVVHDCQVVLVRVREQVSGALLRMVAQQVPLPLLEVADQTYSSRLSLSSTPVLAQVPIQRVERVEELEDRVARVVPEETHRDQRHEVLDPVGHVRVELSRRHADSRRLLLVAVAAKALEEADE